MRFYEVFFIALCQNPSKAIAALYWRLTRRKVRARNMLLRAVGESSRAYGFWIANIEAPNDAGALAGDQNSSVTEEPIVSVLVLNVGTREQLLNTISSVKQQHQSHWELLLAGKSSVVDEIVQGDPRCRVIEVEDDGDVECLKVACQEARSRFLLPLRAGTILSPLALLRFSQTIAKHSDAVILYGDSDSIDDAGLRVKPWFKPQWNKEMFLAQDYITQTCFIRVADARALSGPIDFDGAAVFALVLGLTEGLGSEAAIIHIPHILCHLPVGANSGNQSARAQAVAYLLGLSDEAVQSERGDLVRVHWPLPHNLPMVSIIIPTRDKVDLLQQCVSSVLKKTEYEHFEIIIVDNESIEKDTHEYFSELSKFSNIYIVEYRKNFNYSEMNNMAAEVARGKLLCLLNNDTEVISPGWLGEMVSLASRPETGAVGAKLLYADYSIQHAGVVIGLGGAAGHAHRLQKEGAPGYFDRVHVPHQVSAVTGACLVVDKQKFAAVNGLDAENLKVAFNDVDFCLKLEAAGWRNVYTPHAVLFHHESKSRGKDSAPQNVERYRRELDTLQMRWRTIGYQDPLHHPHLDSSCESYFIRLWPS